LTWLAVRYVSKLPKRGPPAPPPRPAHEVAYERIARLKAGQWLAKGELKEFTFELSEILREYLGLRYHADTLELTTSELLTAMKKRGPAGLSVYALEDFLRATDLVKFAKHVPTHSDAEASLETCEQIISGTRQSDAEIQDMRAKDEIQRALEQPAHPFKRMQAFLADLLMYGFVSTGLILCSRALDWTALLWLNGALFVLFLLFKDAYGVGSLGKVFCGIAITRAEAGASREIPLGDRVLRNLPMLLPIAGQTMEFVVMSYAADGRRIGDRWANTRVLDQQRELSEQAALLYSVALLAALVVVAYWAPFRWLGG
jgi:hypothetical protein